jgi:uncharacterized protein DUF4389
MHTPPSTYPLRLEGTLDSPLSRWQPLVKWLLAIPHAIVLFFLWIAFGALTVVAMFAIVFTGRYPRAIFDFNVGALRWTWRVGFYSYGALGTDRYPPFTLADVPGYPARLEVEYPQSPSRGAALVQWWLLALPHYLIVGVLASVRSLLVFFAAVALLFSGRYPTSIYDLVLGLERWTYRVAAYAGLMTHAYPPFRLDGGGDDPSASATDAIAPKPAAELS